MSNDLEFLQNFQQLAENHEIFQMRKEQAEIVGNLQKEVGKLKENLEYILEPFWQQIKNGTQVI